jgi:hypothetical protein
VAEFETVSRDLPRGTLGIHERLSQDRRSLGRNLKRGPTGHVAEAVPTGPTRSVNYDVQ